MRKVEPGQAGPSFWLGTAFLLPFVVTIGGDYLVIGREYFSLPNDNVPGWFGMALNWIALHPQPFFHHPGYAFQALAGLFVALIGQPGDSPTQGYLDHFNMIGVAAQWVILLGAAVWSARLGKLLGMGRTDMLVLGAVVTTMPTMLTYAWMWCTYFPFGVLVVPSMMALVWAGQPGRWTSGHGFGGLATLGFLVANLYLGAIVIVAAFVAFAGTYRQASAPYPPRMSWSSGWGANGLTAALAALFVTSLSGFAIRAEVFFRLWPAIFAGLLVVGFLGLRWIGWHANGWPRIANVIRSVAFPVLMGWAFGCNVLAPMWGLNARSALFYKGGAAPSHVQWADFDPVGFLLSNVWHLVLPTLLVGAGVFALWRRSGTTIRAAYFIYTLIGLNLVVAADVTLFGQRFLPAMIGQLGRYYIAVLAAIPLLRRDNQDDSAATIRMRTPSAWNGGRA